MAPLRGLRWIHKWTSDATIYIYLTINSLAQDNNRTDAGQLCFSLWQGALSVTTIRLVLRVNHLPIQVIPGTHSLGIQWQDMKLTISVTRTKMCAAVLSLPHSSSCYSGTTSAFLIVFEREHGKTLYEV